MNGKAIVQPVFLKSLAEICVVMGVGKETVQEWISLGAPIAVEKRGKSVRYSAEAVSLQSWRASRKEG